MQRLKLVRSEQDPHDPPSRGHVGAPDPESEGLHGLYVAFSTAGAQRAVIAHRGRVLLDMSYDPAHVTDDDLDMIYHALTGARRRAG